MIKIYAKTSLMFVFIWSSSIFGQSGETPIRLFGYFQNSFQYWPEMDVTTTHPQFSSPEGLAAYTSFTMQQLNLFLSKNLSQHWRAFVNFEFLNNFSTSRQWGAINLEEAWVRYKASDEFNLKIGLLIPAFNNLNEIKNRTPILPYIIRPLVYETSFNEFFSGVEEGTPARAFAQISGAIPTGATKIDYALYVGNSPNINSDRSERQTGIDTTTSFLVGSRVGVRFKDLKLGLSVTHENINLRQVSTDLARYEFIYNEVPRIRLGADLSFHSKRIFVEGELIKILYDDISEIRIDGELRNDTSGETSFDGIFYYGTFGVHFSEEVSMYASYWYLEHDGIFIVSQIPRLITGISVSKISVPTLGIAAKINDKITIKGQYGSVSIKDEFPIPSWITNIVEELQFDIFAVAASVFF